MTPQRQQKAGDLIRLSISISPTLYDEIKAEGIERDMSFSGIVSERLEELADYKRASTKEWKGKLDTALLVDEVRTKDEETSGEGRSAAGSGEVSPSEMGRAVPAPAASTGYPVTPTGEDLAKLPRTTVTQRGGKGASAPDPSPPPAVEYEGQGQVKVNPIRYKGPSPPIPPQADPDKHRGHKVENRGYMMFCVDCKERAR